MLIHLLKILVGLVEENYKRDEELDEQRREKEHWQERYAQERDLREITEEALRSLREERQARYLD
ncbi:MAG TPA: hypothetical protein VEL76_40185 [Gemmataceae bacterium]|nr:hypothetical protein [Gemmataceae bacterium]